jgi:peptidoglycan pentaglycine glycine transferase (the first glycine)
MGDMPPIEWDQFVDRHPSAHLLQTSAWGELKSGFGWQIARIVRGDCGAQILFRKLPIGLSLAYIPKGPLGDRSQWDRLWPHVDAICRRYRSILLIVEPDLWSTDKLPDVQTVPVGFQPGQQTIQPPRTIVVDLSGTEADILSRMKQKTRYNIRLAKKRGIIVQPSSDLEVFHRLMVETGDRDQFGIHSLAYYQRAFDLFNPINQCAILLAEFDGNPIAALMVFACSGRSWYFYGASRDQYREHMPTYLLQWEAMRWARSRGCLEYDLWGVPDADEANLEKHFIQRTDGLWGVYRFKRGFGGELRRAEGPWQRVYNRPLYQFYRWWVMRKTVE